MPYKNRGRRVDAAKLYKDWHWGIPHSHEIEWHEEPYPEHALIECGRLYEIHYKEPDSLQKKRIRLTPAETRSSHLCYDPLHTFQRLYMFVDDGFRSRMKMQYRQNPRYVHGSKYKAMPLADIARSVGGRHGTSDYPNITATPLGILTDVVYTTNKKGDGMSHYIHAMGEESGIRPVVAIDGLGRPWVCGGNYTAPTPGITD